MLEPGIDQNVSNHPPGFGAILEYLPCISAIAPALVTQACECGEKRLAIARIDPLLDCDHNWSPIVFDLLRDYWHRPVHGRR
jgi:hypothetical protein